MHVGIGIVIQRIGAGGDFRVMKLTSENLLLDTLADVLLLT